VTVSKKKPFNIVIRSQKVNAEISNVAIDDISVKMGSCQLASCNFNVDLCGFTNYGWKQGLCSV
jgi:hypothetical protein